jgi:hypothetical protein
MLLSVSPAATTWVPAGAVSVNLGAPAAAGAVEAMRVCGATASAEVR